MTTLTPTTPLFHKKRGPKYKTGPDPARHKKFIAWHRSRAQAIWRHEGWDFDFADWEHFWGELYPRRGRTREAICMVRRDPDLAWTRDNVELIPRQQHARQQQASSTPRPR